MTGWLGACGTTYTMPGVDAENTNRAHAIFAEARAAPPRRPDSAGTGIARFERVARRVQPVAQQLCQQELARRGSVDCNVRLELDRKMTERNAYFTYAQTGNRSPVIRFSVPLLQDAASDDEVAFILGHEYGHMIAQHIQKQQQQAMAGALLLGAITAYGNASAEYSDPDAISENMEIGAALGQRAYSQSYELEADMLGTRISYAAGYDPVRGAQFFARSEAARRGNGSLSFWGTHPPNARRMEVVMATVDEIRGRQGLVKAARR